MPRKVQFEAKADKVNIEVVWKAFTIEKFEVAEKADPDLFAEWKVLEGDGHGNIVLGSLLYYRLGSDAPNVEPFKERVVELDETNHLVKFQGIEGGFMKQGLACYIISLKVDSVGEGNTIINVTINYDLDKGVDGTQLLEQISVLFNYYLNSVVGYLQKKNNA